MRKSGASTPGPGSERAENRTERIGGASGLAKGAGGIFGVVLVGRDKVHVAVEAEFPAASWLVVIG